jgi:hypothetical protein
MADVGCGNGKYMSFVKYTIGSDRSPNLCAITRGRSAASQVSVLSILYSMLTLMVCFESQCLFLTDSRIQAGMISTNRRRRSDSKSAARTRWCCRTATMCLTVRRFILYFNVCPLLKNCSNIVLAQL